MSQWRRKAKRNFNVVSTRNANVQQERNPNVMKKYVIVRKAFIT